MEVKLIALSVMALSLLPMIALAQEGTWPVHSMDRPKPLVVDPGPERPPVPPPSDATVLFDGRDLSPWEGDTGEPAGWTIRNGYLEVKPGSGSIHTRAAFGSIQLHVEWAAPAPPHGEGQERGNSGVFLMSRYELQVLDSWHNDTYADGQAAAMYGQRPPLVNASRPPGKWQSYDIVFVRPRFAPDGHVLEPARVTVFHNGVVVHHDAPFTGRTVHGKAAQYEAHEDRLPLLLQDHGVPVRFRNIWVRELAD
jgi:hypothetical protein